MKTSKLHVSKGLLQQWTRLAGVSLDRQVAAHHRKYTSLTALRFRKRPRFPGPIMFDPNRSFASLQKPEPLIRKCQDINLLPVERLLRKLLLDFTHESTSADSSTHLQIWFTGGWVRDKLLGIQTMDIDAALSTMTGMQFGEGLEAFYLKNQNIYTQEAERLGVSSKFKMHQVQKRPEKSKHLETCTICIFGLDVDFVNLRGETYAEDSRNPQMEFATAEEDALRRDATVNALFYDIIKLQVEDFTGKGLQDMTDAILRTPLDPYQTFLDDPLRVLRLIRFASKLGYTIESGAIQSMKDQKIHLALNAKISRERVRIEVIKMMQGRNPLAAFDLLHETGLYSTVFLNSTSHTARSMHSLSQSEKLGTPWPATWPNAYRLLAKLLQENTMLGKSLVVNRDITGIEDAWLMAAYAPVTALRHSDTKKVLADIKDAMKLTQGNAKLVDDGFRHLDGIRSTIEETTRHSLHQTTLVSSSLHKAI